MDTQILLWWVEDESRPPARHSEAIASRDNQVLVSVVSLWEIVIKVRVKKLEADVGKIMQAIGLAGLDRLPIEPAHLQTLADLPRHHKDPFDHLLLAQAISENAKMMSVDRVFRDYPVDLY